MTAFGAGRTAHILTLPRAELLRQLRRQPKRATFRHEEARREKVVTEIAGPGSHRKIRVTTPVEALEARLAGLGLALEAVSPLHVAAHIPDPPRTTATGQAAPACDPHTSATGSPSPNAS